MPKLAVVALLAALAAPRAIVHAQTDSAAVLAVVTQLFDGMRTRDTSLMRSLFAPNARLLAIDTTKTPPDVRGLDPGVWISSVGRSTGPAADERIFDPIVHLDGNIAQVWTYYELWVGPRLSHCGYDAFLLVKLAGRWKVAQVADTRRTPCTPR